MSGCKAPRWALPATGERNTAACTSPQSKWARPLAPYCQPLLRRNFPSPSSSAAARRVGVEASSHARRPGSPAVIVEETSTAAGTDVLNRLTPDEWSICNLMVSMLQYKSTEEARQITAEVSQMALSRRLLSRYSGVYASVGHMSVNGDAQDEEGRRGELIRHLQHRQYRREEEKREHALSSNGKNVEYGENEEEEDIRARCRKLFLHSGNANGAKRAYATKTTTTAKPSKKKPTPTCNSKPEGEGRKPQESYQQDKPADAMEEHQKGSTLSVPLNVPRRVKPLKGVPSFDEGCADRYGGAAYSNESMPTASLHGYPEMGVVEDSVQRSFSFLSAGAANNDHDARTAPTHVYQDTDDDTKRDNGVSSLLHSIPARCETAEPTLSDCSGLPLRRPTSSTLLRNGETNVGAQLTSPSPLSSSLISPSPSSYGSDSTYESDGGEGEMNDGVTTNVVDKSYKAAEENEFPCEI